MSTILDTIKKNLRKIHPYGDLLNDPEMGKVTDYISTGNYDLNMSISGSFFKGIANNKIFALAGESGTGKTFILLNIYKNAIEKGYTIYHFDTEGAITDEEMINFGIYDAYLSGQFNLIPVSIIEDFNKMVIQIIDPLVDEYKKLKKASLLPKVMLGCDSIGNLASRKEYEDNKKGEEKVDMTAAKKVRSFFRQITVPCSVLKIPFLFTAHTYVTTSFIPQTKLNKGEGLVYAASNILLLRKKQLKDGDSKVGIIITAKPHKNRSVIPYEVQMQLRFTSGMNPYFGLHKYTTWDLCGIDRGKLTEEMKELPLLDEEGNEQFYKSGKNKGLIKTKMQLTGETTFTVIKTPTKGDSFIVKHTNQEYKPNQIFNKNVFTPEIMEILDKDTHSKVALSSLADDMITDEELELENKTD